jgi:hypothetical protein
MPVFGFRRASAQAPLGAGATGADGIVFVIDRFPDYSPAHLKRVSPGAFELEKGRSGVDVLTRRVRVDLDVFQA